MIVEVCTVKYSNEHLFLCYGCPLDNNNIQTLSGDIVTPNDILSFFTGASTEPPLGFDRKTKLYFSDRTLASASTCGLQLTLPIHKSVKKKMWVAS